MTVIVTGSAGFIGFHLCKRLLNAGETVICIDNMNDYYDTNLKYSRLKIIRNLSNNNFYFFQKDIQDKNSIREIFSRYKVSKVVNLAAQAGVRYSLTNP